jgi:hypothetical protein
LFTCLMSYATYLMKWEQKSRDWVFIGFVDYRDQLPSLFSEILIQFESAFPLKTRSCYLRMEILLSGCKQVLKRSEGGSVIQSVEGRRDAVCCEPSPESKQGRFGCSAGAKTDLSAA